MAVVLVIGMTGFGQADLQTDAALSKHAHCEAIYGKDLCPSPRSHRSPDSSPESCFRHPAYFNAIDDVHGFFFLKLVWWVHELPNEGTTVQCHFKTRRAVHHSVTHIRLGDFLQNAISKTAVISSAFAIDEAHIFIAKNAFPGRREKPPERFPTTPLKQ